MSTYDTITRKWRRCCQHQSHPRSCKARLTPTQAIHNVHDDTGSCQYFWVPISLKFDAGFANVQRRPYHCISILVGEPGMSKALSSMTAIVGKLEFLPTTSAAQQRAHECTNKILFDRIWIYGFAGEATVHLSQSTRVCDPVMKSITCKPLWSMIQPFIFTTESPITPSMYIVYRWT